MKSELDVMDVSEMLLEVVHARECSCCLAPGLAGAVGRMILVLRLDEIVAVLRRIAHSALIALSSSIKKLPHATFEDVLGIVQSLLMPPQRVS